ARAAFGSAAIARAGCACRRRSATCARRARSTARERTRDAADARGGIFPPRDCGGGRHDDGLRGHHARPRAGPTGSIAAPGYRAMNEEEGAVSDAQLLQYLHEELTG